MIRRIWRNEPVAVLGTGPSLAGQIAQLQVLRAAGRVRLMGMNATYAHFPVLDAFTACNIEWWDYYGEDFRRRHPACLAWHWDRECAARHGVDWIEGRWGRGLSTDNNYIHYGHSSGVQALNIAVHLGGDPVLLVGFEMTETSGEPRHYFSDLSDTPGEYPQPLRHRPKLSNGHEGLLPIYRDISRQPGLPAIINCTPGGKLDYFPRAALGDVLADE